MTIGFIGLGAFGGRVATRLVFEGHGLMIHDCVTDAVRYFMLKNSADVAEAPRTIASLCDIAIAVLPTPADVRTIAIGRMGLVDGIPEGKRITLIDLGTSNAAECAALAAELAPCGIDYVEAPAYGSTQEVREGKLVIPYGCDDPAVAEKVAPLLRALATRINHTGAVGSAHALGALVEQMRAGALLAAAEAIVAGRKAGVAPQALLDWAQGAGLLAPAIFSALRNHSLAPAAVGSGHTMGALTQNLALARQLANLHGLALKQSEITADLWQAAMGARGAEADHADILRWVEANAVAAKEEGGPANPLPAG